MRLGDGDKQTWAVERSALQVGDNTGMHSFLTCRLCAESVFPMDAYVDVAFYYHPYLTKWMDTISFYDTEEEERCAVSVTMQETEDACVPIQ